MIVIVGDLVFIFSLIQQDRQLIVDSATPKSDIWSFGLIMYELLAGQQPLESSHNLDELRKSQQISEEIFPLLKFSAEAPGIENLI
jgi:serine/threonine protein kinase